MPPLQRIFIVQGQQFDLYPLLYNNTSNLHLCHQDLQTTLVPLIIMHIRIPHCSNFHNSNKHCFNNKLSNPKPNLKLNIITALRMFSNLTHLKGIA